MVVHDGFPNVQVFPELQHQIEMTGRGHLIRLHRGSAYLLDSSGDSSKLSK